MITTNQCDRKIDNFMKKKEVEFPELGLPFEDLYEQVVSDNKPSARRQLVKFKIGYIRIRPHFQSNRLGLAR